MFEERARLSGSGWPLSECQCRFASVSVEFLTAEHRTATAARPNLSRASRRCELDLTLDCHFGLNRFRASIASQDGFDDFRDELVDLLRGAADELLGVGQAVDVDVGVDRIGF